MALPSIVARDGDKKGIPVSLIEAMACGLPVVATDNGGIPELLEGEAGLIVPERDVPALAGAMARLMDDVPLHAAMVVKARARIESEYDIKVIADRLERGFTRGHL
jgi:colanic acid/amylovoran biosynthesis glycosyltransferase